MSEKYGDLFVYGSDASIYENLGGEEKEKGGKGSNLTDAKKWHQVRKSDCDWYCSNSNRSRIKMQRQNGSHCQT